MHRRQAPGVETSRVSSRQSGVVSRAQAADTAPRVIDRLVRDGAWQALGHGVYLTSSGEIGWLSRVWAGLLIGGDTARTAGLTAATLHGLADDQRLPVEVLVRADAARPANRGWVTFRRERVGVRLPSAATTPPRIRLEDAVIDLAARGRPAEVVGWVTSAIQRRLTAPDRLRAAVDRRERVAHRALLHALLEEATIGVHSPLEHRYLRDVERAHGLPAAVRQFRIESRSADAAYVEFGLLVELDGLAWHDPTRDRRRDNDHALRQWVTLRYGWAEVVGDPCRVAREVAAVLRQLGWTGHPHACSRCVEI